MKKNTSYLLKKPHTCMYVNFYLRYLDTLTPHNNCYKIWTSPFYCPSVSKIVWYIAVSVDPDQMLQNLWHPIWVYTFLHKLVCSNKLVNNYLKTINNYRCTLVGHESLNQPAHLYIVIKTFTIWSESSYMLEDTYWYTTARVIHLLWFMMYIQDTVNILKFLSFIPFFFGPRFLFSYPVVS